MRQSAATTGRDSCYANPSISVPFQPFLVETARGMVTSLCVVGHVDESSLSKVLQTSGTDGTIQKLSDFSGDGKADLIWRSADGAIVIWLMDGLLIIDTAVCRYQ
jgi:hypothetical protein